MNSETPESITTTVACTTREGGQVKLTLVFDVVEPLDVLMLFTERDRVSTWIVGRELLADSLRRPMGEGDIRLEVRHGHLVIGLSSPNGTGQLMCSAWPIREFVARANDLCRPCHWPPLHRPLWQCVTPNCLECAAIRADLTGWLLDNDLSDEETEGPHYAIG